MKFVVSHKWLNSARCDNHRGKKPLVRLTNYERDLRSGLLLCEECCKALFEDEKLQEHFKLVSYEEEKTDETNIETPEEEDIPEEDSIDELENEIDEVVTDEKKVIKATLNETTEVKEEGELIGSTAHIKEPIEDPVEFENFKEEAEQESLFGDEAEEVDELLADVDELLAPEDKSPKLVEESVESDVKTRIAKAENLNELRDIAKEVGCNLRSMTNIKNIKTKLVRHVDSMEV